MKSEKLNGMLALILLVGLLLRLVWIVLTPALPTSDFYWYNRVALNLAGGSGFAYNGGYPTAYRPPAYPVFLVIIYILSNGISPAANSLLAAKLANTFLGVLTIWLTYCLAARYFSERTALLGTAFVALLPSLILYSGLLASENLVIPLLLASLLCADLGWQKGQTVRRSFAWMLAAGFLVGLAALTRGVFLLLPGVWLAWGWARRRSWRALPAPAIALVLGTTMALLPWIVRNATVFGRFMPLSTNGGVNLLISFNPTSRGYYVPVDNIPGYKKLAALGLDEFAMDQATTNLALNFVRNQPLRAVALAPLKVFHLYRDDVSGVSWNDSNPQLPLPPWLRICLIGVTQAYYMALLFASLAAIVRRDKVIPDSGALFLLLPILYLTIVHSIYFGSDRYHLPILPLLAIMAAGPVSQLLTDTALRNSRRLSLRIHSSKENVDSA